MADTSFSKLLSSQFQGANAALVRRTRIDARTVGYPADSDEKKVEWMGMSPAAGKGDLWYVILAEEEPNQYLSQIDQNERLVDIVKVMGRGEEGPLSFEKAVEYLAVWEHARKMKGATVAADQSAEELGRHYYKDLLMRRGFVVSTTGSLTPVSGIMPTEAGRYIKSDLTGIGRHNSELRGDDALDELLRAHNPLYISDTTLDDDIESFGEIGLFSKMRDLAQILVEYAKVKLHYVETFYSNPAQRKEEADLLALLNGHAFFSAEQAKAFNALKADLAPAVFRFFHVDRADWDKELDFTSQTLRVALLKNPDAKETYDYLQQQVSFPMAQEDIDTVLFTAARGLVYFREMLHDSPQKDAMERQGIYSQADIDNLLNFLDLLHIKFMYIELAEAAIALPGTRRHKELGAKKDDFKRRVENLKDNLKSADFSAAQEKQVDQFIKASAPIYLLDRIEALPQKLEAVHQYIADKVLPRPHQLSLDLDFAASRKQGTARAARTSKPGIL